MDNSEQNRFKGDFVIGRTQKFESAVPHEVTEQALVDYDLAERPRYGSAMVENFIIDSLAEGIESTQALKQRFVDTGNKDNLNQYLSDTKLRAEKIKLEELVTRSEIDAIKKTLAEELKTMRAPEEVIEKLHNTEVELTGSFGMSNTKKDSVSISRYQIVRKAADYIAVWPDMQLEEVLRALLTAVIAHELGHKIDDYSGIATNKIPITWKNHGLPVENRSERFAEYWGRVGIANNPSFTDIRQKRNALDVKTVADTWQALKVYNDAHPDNKLDVWGIWDAILETVTPEETDVLRFLEARQAYYAGNEPENYSLPYSRQSVSEALRVN